MFRPLQSTVGLCRIPLLLVASNRASSAILSAAEKLTAGNSECAKIERAILKNELKPVIGLEIHAQLLTESKLFSNARATLAPIPNSHVSYLDAALPGTLPVLNARCVELAVRTGLALHCEIAPECRFDRKHYFYADLPHGYQITQQEQPIARNGWIEFIVYDMQCKPYRKRVPLKQIQLEQDSGKSLADEAAGVTLVDLNRAGTALLEFVFDPVLESPLEAVCLAKELHLLLQKIEVCSGKMEEGALRVDANVSVHRPTEPFGTRTEIKNLNSFKSLGRGIESEIDRHIDILASGRQVQPDTRAFDHKTRKTFAMRDKVSVADYRFLPEPNLPPLRIAKELNQVNLFGRSNCVVESECEPDTQVLPEQSRKLLLDECGLSLEYTFRIMLLPGAFELFKRLRDDDPRRDAHLLANYILTEVYTFLKEQKLLYTDLPIEPDFVGQCVDLLQADEITEGVAFDLLHLRMSGDLRTACEIVAEHKWTKAAEREVIDRLVREAIAFEPYYSSIYAKKAKSFALNQILLRLDVIGRKTVSRQTAKRVIDQLLRNSNNDSTNNSDRPAD